MYMKVKTSPQKQKIYPQKVTIDDLALMVGKGFAGIDTQLDSMNVRLDSMDVRLDGIDVHLDKIDVHLDGIDVRLDGIDIRLDGIDGRLDRMDERFDDVDTRLVSMESGNYNRLTRLETTVKAITHVLEKDLHITLPK